MSRFPIANGVRVQIESKIVVVDVLFDNAGLTAVAGRALLLAAFDIGMTTTDWLRTT